MTIRAVALFSGGLDSMLACRVIMDQGIEVTAVRFVTPFFGYDLLADPQGFARRVQRTYGITAMLRDISEPYLAMLRQPAHGYGKHFNPCIDCKILMLRQARLLMEELGGSFLITGEVLGQRPMSQRRDALRVVERDSGCEDVLLRPLCARNLPPTPMEEQGLVDRERLLDFKGRGRHGQMALAAHYGITDYPSPAGGCTLTDPTLGERVKRFFAEYPRVTTADARLLLVGRQFRLPAGAWLVLGRNHQENKRLEPLAITGDWLCTTADRPGPLGVLRFGDDAGERRLAASILARYAKKGGAPEVRVVMRRGDEEEEHVVPPLADAELDPWRR